MRATGLVFRFLLLFALPLAALGESSSGATGSDGTWTRLDLPGPNPKAEHVAAFDPIGNRMVVFGSISGTVGSDETWLLDLSGPPYWQQLSAPVRPAGRSTASLVYDSQAHRMLLFGGYGGEYLNDVWQLTLGATPVWSPVSTTTPAPETRHYSAGIYDPVGNQLVIVGGYRGGPTYSDVWALDLGTSPATWREILPTGATFPPSFGHSGSYDPFQDRLLVTGSAVGTEVWELRLRPSPVWTRLTTIGGTSTSHLYRTTLFDQRSDRLLAFGGYPPTDSLWEISLTPGTAIWRPLTPAGLAPEPRYLHSAVLDAVENRMIVYGGRDPSGHPTYSEVSILSWNAPHLLTTTIVGEGTVSRQPDRPSYEPGEVVELAASPSPGWSFSGWSGDVTDTAANVSIVMDADKVVVANFVQDAAPTVHVAYPNGNEILVLDSDYKLAWNASDSLGVAEVDVELTRDDGVTYEPIATGLPNSGSLVWHVTGPPANTSPEPVYRARIRVTARDQVGNSTSDESDEAFAIYDLTPPHTVSVSSVGRGGVSRSPDQTYYEEGGAVTLVAQPEVGWEFISWSGDTTSTENPLALPTHKNRNVIAMFRDAMAPEAALIYPNGGQIFIPGSEYKLTWFAADAVGVSAVDLAVSRDTGATWVPIATVANHGTYVWRASRPGSNSGLAVGFSCLLRISARDSAGNVTVDQSSAPFAIHDLTPLSVETGPASFSLGPVEPNPLRGSGSISFDLPNSGYARLSVHDLQGREVAVLREGLAIGGQERVRWTPCSAGDCVAPGIYFLVLRSSFGVLSRRVVLTR